MKIASTMANRRFDRPDRRRRGFTVIVVLALLSIALALSYSLMRSQATAIQIQANGDLRILARQAAWSGLSVGLRKMRDPAWGGVSATVAGDVGPGQSFIVTYETGDPSIAVGGADNPDWPYRVLLTATGSAASPIGGGRGSTHAVQAVVRLAPKSLAAEPADWAAIQQHTLYQYDAGDVEMQLPCRVAGSVRLQGALKNFLDSYPTPSAANTRYASDLNAMRNAGRPDYRPFEGPVNLPFSRTDSTTRAKLTATLGVSVANIASTGAAGWSHPGTIGGYQLYPGGKTYSATVVSQDLANVSLAADPRSNPLGLFVRSGDVRLRDNVQVQGTLIVTGSLTLDGDGIVLAPASLPSLVGSNQPIQLPAAAVGRSFIVNDRASASVQGLVAAWDDFSVSDGSSSTNFDMTGRIVCDGFRIEDRNDWNGLLSGVFGGLLWNSFTSQATAPNGVIYYPLWLNGLGFKMAPSIAIGPPANSTTYHWKKATDPIYVAAASDPGLCWDLVQIGDVP